MSQENVEIVRRAYIALSRCSRFSAKGRASGANVETYVANLWTLGGDGKLIEVKYFGDDRAAALEAAGLRE
jgi:hypothetical protein